MDLERIERLDRYLPGTDRDVGLALKMVRERISDGLAPRTGMNAVRDQFGDIRARTTARSPVVVDGGAFEGETTRRFLELFDDPTVHAFEPNPDLARELRGRFGDDDRVVVHEEALGGSSEPVPFHLTSHRATASILRPSSRSQSFRDDLFSVEEEVEVEQVRLDDAVSDPVDVIKLDIQGYTLPALRGAGSHLDSADLVYTEVEFVEMYRDQPLFRDVSAFLADEEFSLCNLYDQYTDSEGALLWADALFEADDPATT